MARTYEIMGQVEAHKWMMIPLVFTSEEECTRLEKVLIKRLGSINRRVAHNAHSLKVLQNVKLHVDCMDLTPVPQAPPPITRWRLGGGAHGPVSDLNVLMKSITAGNVPITVMADRGVLHATNFESFGRKHGSVSIQFGSENPTTVGKATRRIERGEPFKVLDVSRKSSRKPIMDILLHLARHVGATKSMRNVLTDTQLRGCF